ncbi:hypothetical protein LOD99_858 [Oopsacas minuta]|uniref:Uncharacterized protein n=1 Tax=Oopsacas minuta TaxID=111878 RepID=A0AAV7JZX8_9METZ|nr:hypothetical protein LOD99_858 [Oopsacas minuta]
MIRLLKHLGRAWTQGALPTAFQGIKVVNDAFNSITTYSPPRWTDGTDVVPYPEFFLNWILHFNRFRFSKNLIRLLTSNAMSGVTAHFIVLNCISICEFD